MSSTLQNRLAECLAAKGIRKSQLAYRLKMTRAYVTRLERGDIRPSFETAIRIARYFDKPVEEIFQLIEQDGESAKVNPLVKSISRPPSAASVKNNNSAETMKG
ncbi:MAG TPA: helix-turn-helix transcriptional regulator [Verrucomicrobiae bacterium]|jgi:putative transcriptional regulator